MSQHISVDNVDNPEAFAEIMGSEEKVVTAGSEMQLVAMIIMLIMMIINTIITTSMTRVTIMVVMVITYS